MKHLTKIIFTLLALFILLVSNVLSTSAAEDVRPLIIVGGTWAPYEYYEIDQITGINVEVIEIIMDRLDIPYEIRFLPFSASYKMVQEGSADAHLSLSYKESREEFVYYTPDQIQFGKDKTIPQNYLHMSEYVFFTNKEYKSLEINSYEDIKKYGYKLGIIEGYSYNSEFWDANLTATTIKDTTEAFRKLEHNEIELLFMDKTGGIADLKSIMLLQEIGHLDKVFLSKPYSVQFSKNSDFPDIEDVMNKFNIELSKLKETGEYQAIYDKYLKELPRSANSDILNVKVRVKEKAHDIAKQIEIYLKLNPDKTLKELQKDSYFKDIAVQTVGSAGYSILADCNTFTFYFHPNPALVDKSPDETASTVFGFETIRDRAIGCLESEGIYNLKEENETIQKYMYIAPVNAKTSENINLSVIATTNINEVEAQELTLNLETNTYSSGIDLEWRYIILAVIGIVVFIFFLGSIESETKYKQLKFHFKIFSVTGVLLLLTYTSRIHTHDPILTVFLIRASIILAYLMAVSFSITLLSIVKQNLKKTLTYPGYIMTIVIGPFFMLTSLFVEKAFVNPKIFKAYGILDFSNGILYPVTIGLFSIYIFGFSINVLNEYLKNRKTNKRITVYFIITAFISAIVIAIHAIAYGFLGFRNPVWFLIYPLILAFTIGFSLFKLKFIIYKKSEILSAITIIIFLVISLFVFNTYNVVRDMESEMINSYVKQSHLELVHANERIDRFINFISIDVKQISLEPKFTKNNEEILLALSQLHTRFDNQIGGSYVVNKEGIVVARWPELNRIGANFSEKDGIKTVLKTEKFYISDVITTGSGEKAITISSPIFKDGEFHSILRVLIYIPDLGDTYIEGHFDDEILYLIDNYNYTLYDSKTGMNYHSIITCNKTDLTFKNAILKSMNTEKPQNTLFNQNINGTITERVVLAHPFKIFDKTWVLALTRSKEDILKQFRVPITDIWRSTFTLIIILIFSGITLNWILTRSLKSEVDSKTKELNKFNKNLEKTVRKRTVALKTANEKLHALNKVKDNFISSVSHELRTPLTSIKSYNQLLYDQILGSITKKQKDALKIILMSTDHLEGIINDILDVSRYEANKYELVCEKDNLNDTIKEVVQEFKPIVKKVNGKITIKSKHKKETLSMDKDKIKQVLRNLINNSIKYKSSKKLKIDIELKIVKKKFMEITISDNGLGMPKENLDHIFDKFYQVDQTSTRKVEGTGLGLSIVSQIMSLHKGKIKVKSKLDKGTEITLLIPMNLKPSNEPNLP